MFVVLHVKVLKPLMENGSWRALGLGLVTSYMFRHKFTNPCIGINEANSWDMSQMVRNGSGRSCPPGSVLIIWNIGGRMPN